MRPTPSGEQPTAVLQRPRREGRVVGEPPHGGGDLAGVGGIEREFRKQEFADRRRGRANRRDAAPIGLEHRQAETLDPGRENEGFGHAVEGREVVAGRSYQQMRLAGGNGLAHDRERVGPPAEEHDPRLVAERGWQQLTSALDQLVEKQGVLGLEEEAVDRAGRQFDTQSTLISSQIVNLEEADPYETSLRLNTLQTQLEASFSVTSRISQLSLVNFM